MRVPEAPEVTQIDFNGGFAPRSANQINSGFSGQYPKKPETRSSGSGRVGLGFLGLGFFRVGDPTGVKNSGRVGFQKFGFFAHPSTYLLNFGISYIFYILSNSCPVFDWPLGRRLKVFLCGFGPKYWLMETLGTKI